MICFDFFIDFRTYRKKILCAPYHTKLTHTDLNVKKTPKHIIPLVNDVFLLRYMQVDCRRLCTGLPGVPP